MRRVFAIALALSLLPAVASALPRGELPKDKKLSDTKKPVGIPGEPGSGLPLESAPRGTDASRLRAPLPLRPADKREADALTDMEALMKRYKDGHDAMAHTVGQTLIVQGAAGKRALEQSYDKSIKDKQANARKMRAQAVRRYDDFLKLHPDDPSWTPEIMFLRA